MQFNADMKRSSCLRHQRTSAPSHHQTNNTSALLLPSQLQWPANGKLCNATVNTSSGLSINTTHMHVHIPTRLNTPRIRVVSVCSAPVEVMFALTRPSSFAFSAVLCYQPQCGWAVDSRTDGRTEIWHGKRVEGSACAAGSSCKSLP